MTDGVALVFAIALNCLFRQLWKLIRVAYLIRGRPTCCWWSRLIIGPLLLIGQWTILVNVSQTKAHPFKAILNHHRQSKASPHLELMVLTDDWTYVVMVLQHLFWTTMIEDQDCPIKGNIQISATLPVHMTWINRIRFPNHVSQVEPKWIIITCYSDWSEPLKLSTSFGCLE